MYYISNFIRERNMRPVNEDSVCLCHVMFNNHPLLLAAVCDGVGGLKDGEYASRFVISNVKSCFESLDRTRSISLSSLAKALSRVIYSCHKELNLCATTLCAAIIYRKHCHILYCGDSRIYLGNRRLHLITKDDVDSSGRLTNHIGYGQIPVVKKRRYRLTNGSTLLLCSDGFYKRNTYALSGNYFSRCKDESSIREKLIELYNNAVLKGEQDNCSAIVIKALRKETI